MKNFCWFFSLLGTSYLSSYLFFTHFFAFSSTMFLFVFASFLSISPFPFPYNFILSPVLSPPPCLATLSLLLVYSFALLSSNLFSIYLYFPFTHIFPSFPLFPSFSPLSFALSLIPKVLSNLSALTLLFDLLLLFSWLSPTLPFSLFRLLYLPPAPPSLLHSFFRTYKY
jgi:hypothetical protein